MEESYILRRIGLMPEDKCEIIVLTKSPTHIGTNRYCDYRLRSSSSRALISEFHASILFFPTDATISYYVMDNNSKHGTFLNSVKVSPHQECYLKVGSIITFGCNRGDRVAFGGLLPELNPEFQYMFERGHPLKHGLQETGGDSATTFSAYKDIISMHLKELHRTEQLPPTVQTLVRKGHTNQHHDPLQLCTDLNLPSCNASYDTTGHLNKSNTTNDAASEYTLQLCKKEHRLPTDHDSKPIAVRVHPQTGIESENALPPCRKETRRPTNNEIRHSTKPIVNRVFVQTGNESENVLPLCKKEQRRPVNSEVGYLSKLTTDRLNVQSESVQTVLVKEPCWPAYSRLEQSDAGNEATFEAALPQHNDQSGRAEHLSRSQGQDKTLNDIRYGSPSLQLCTEKSLPLNCASEVEIERSQNSADQIVQVATVNGSGRDTGLLQPPSDRRSTSAFSATATAHSPSDDAATLQLSRNTTREHRTPNSDSRTPVSAQKRHRHEDTGVDCNGESGGKRPKGKKGKKVSDEPYETCSAPDGCLQPDAQKVLWVQCDKCDEWYHTDCIKLPSANVKQLKSIKFVCSLCQSDRQLIN